LDPIEELRKLTAELSEAVKKSPSVETIKGLVAEAVKKSAEEQGNGRKAEFAMDVEGNIGSKEPLMKMSTTDPKIRELQRYNDELMILKTLMPLRPVSSFRIYKRFQNFLSTSELLKAMTTGGAGEGAEWVPTGFSSDLIDMIKLKLVVAAQHPRVRMPTDPFKIPGKKSSSTAYLKTEAVAPGSGETSVVGTRQIILDAKTLIAYVPCSYELSEDSIVPLLPMIKGDIVQALADAEENATINGDTAGSHMDSDVTNAKDQRKAWNGYRKLVLDGAKQDLGTFNAENVMKVRTGMGKYGANPAAISWISSVLGLGKLMLMKDSSGNLIFLTRDKYGEDAVVVKGELGKCFGSPLLVSEFVRDDLNASGVYDGTTTNKSILLCVRREAFVYGDRRAVLVETDKDIKAQTIDLVSSQRIDFKDRIDATTERIVGMGYNFDIV